MIVYLTRQDLAQRFSGNSLGLTWALLAPVLQLALFAVVFGLIFQARIPGLDAMGYVVYLSMGMWPWFAFSDAVARGTTAYTDQAGLLAKVAIEPWRLVAARVISAFVLHGAGFLAVMLLLWAFTPHITPHYLPATLLAWSTLAGIAFGLALLFSVVHVFFRDLQQIVQYAMTAIMFMTPILYSAQMGPEAIRELQRFNPFASIIPGIRDAVMGGDLQHAIPISGLIFAAILLPLAGWTYARFRRHLVDFL